MIRYTIYQNNIRKQLKKELKTYNYFHLIYRIDNIKTRKFFKNIQILNRFLNSLVA